MSYKYLTGQFVEHMDLEMVPVHLPRNQGLVCGFSDDYTLPPAGQHSWVQGVIFRGYAYVKEDDEPSFVRSYNVV